MKSDRTSPRISFPLRIMAPGAKVEPSSPSAARSNCHPATNGVALPKQKSVPPPHLDPQSSASTNRRILCRRDCNLEPAQPHSFVHVLGLEIQVRRNSTSHARSAGLDQYPRSAGCGCLPGSNLRKKKSPPFRNPLRRSPPTRMPGHPCTSTRE